MMFHPIFKALNNKLILHLIKIITRPIIMFDKCIWPVLWVFSLPHVPSTNLEEGEFITYIVVSHQVAGEADSILFY